MKKIKLLLIVVSLILLGLEFVLIDRHHLHGLLEKLPGSHLLLGILAGVGLMFFAKALGAYWLYRNSGYYCPKKKEEASS